MVTVNDRDVIFREGMRAFDAIAEAGFTASAHIVLINSSVVSDVHSYQLQDDDEIHLLTLFGGG